MNSCEKCNIYFDKALYNELLNDENIFFTAHLEECDKCANEFGRLKDALTFVVENRERIEPTQEFESNFWDELEPKLATPPSIIKTIIISIKEWYASNRSFSYQLAGGAALIIVGILLGRTFFTNNAQSLPADYEVSQRQAAIQASAERYLDRSKVLLLGMMNFDPAIDDAGTISLDHQKIISRELLAQASSLKSDLNKPSTRQLQNLVADLEVILLQIANLEAEFDLSGIDLIQNGIDRKGIFLKINIQKMLKANSKSDKQSEIEKNNI